MYLKHSDILDILSKELEMPLPQLEVIFVDFFAHLKDLLVNAEFSERVMVSNCFRVKFNEKAFAKKYIKVVKRTARVWGFPTVYFKKIHKVHEEIKKRSGYQEEQLKAIEAVERHYLSEEFWSSTYESTGGGRYRSRRGAGKKSE